jgi:hypothetical protein
VWWFSPATPVFPEHPEHGLSSPGPGPELHSKFINTSTSIKEIIVSKEKLIKENVEYEEWNGSS